jgi:ribosome-binding ATPase YchF (GTP1/OBG family)
MVNTDAFWQGKNYVVQAGDIIHFRFTGGKS